MFVQGISLSKNPRAIIDIELCDFFCRHAEPKAKRNDSTRGGSCYQVKVICDFLPRVLLDCL